MANQLMPSQGSNQGLGNLPGYSWQYSGNQLMPTPSGYQWKDGSLSSLNAPPPQQSYSINQQYNPYNTPAPLFGGDAGGNRQYQGSNVNQIPVNVLDVRSKLSDLLGSYQSQAANYLNNFMSASQSMPQASLGTNFAGPEQLNKALSGGVDYFGNLGMSQGLQNINLQRDTANRQLQNVLGRNAGNQSLINVLQNQNLFKSQLAGIPLLSEAQQGTYNRAGDYINQQNNLQNLLNQTNLSQQGFNLQSLLAGLQAQSGAIQPMTNLLDVLSQLQGQQRGVTSSEAQVGSRNF